MAPHGLSPALFFDTANAYQRSAALKAAVELDLFSVMGEGRSAAEIAKSCHASERGVRILCDYLVISGFAVKDGERYRNTPESQMFLSKSSPAYLGGALQFLHAPGLTDGFRDVAACVRRGGTVLEGSGTVDEDDPVWVDFAQGMMPLMMMPAREIAELIPFPRDREIDILDLAAGHGIFGIMAAKAFPRAQVTAVDWRAVLEVAKENAKKFEVIDRYRTIAGSAFDADFGTARDVVLITNFLHHFDPETCVSVLKKVRASLKPGGVAITLEFIPNEDRVSPPSAGFSLIMLCSTPSGDAYTFSELNEMLTTVGFSRSKLLDLPGGMQRVIISEC